MNNDTVRLSQASEATEEISQSTVTYIENVAAAIKEHTATMKEVTFST